MAEQCTAKAKSTGQRCGKPAIPGGTVCRIHGGATPVIKAAGQRRLAEQQARAAVELFAARRDIHPAEALLELVHWTAGEVDYWRQRVRDVEEDDLTWGTTKVKEGGDDRGITQEAKPHIAYTMLVDASNRLERYASAALKAGVEERRVALAESQGAAVATALSSVLRAMFEVVIDTLRAHQVDDAQIIDALREAWSRAMGVIVPRELRALSGGDAA